MYLGLGRNTYGTVVSKFECNTCGQPYTVCPSLEEINISNWQNCLEVGCNSYDTLRDADKFFDGNIIPIRGIKRLSHE
jgi:hypothetical protein